MRTINNRSIGTQEHVKSEIVNDKCSRTIFTKTRGAFVAFVVAGVCTWSVATDSVSTQTMTFPVEFIASSLESANGSNGSAGTVFIGGDHNEQIGTALTGLGDINNDGLDDLLIGAPLSDQGAARFPQGGNAYIVFGQLGGFAAEFEVKDLLPENGGDGSQGFVVYGDGAEYNVGASGAGVGDINGDGIDDFLVGTDHANESGQPLFAGQFAVIFGRSDGFPADISYSSLRASGGGDGSTGFIVRGINSFDQSGVRVSGVGDVNDDGFNDIAVAAPFANLIGPNQSGEVYVLYGRANSYPASFDLATLLPENGGDGSEGFVLSGEPPFFFLGQHMNSGGDFNNDGTHDIVIGSQGSSLDGEFSSGAVVVMYGRSTGFNAQYSTSDFLNGNNSTGELGFVVPGFAEFGSMGAVATGIGDINHDGIDDLGIAGYSPELFGRGELYVVYGKSQGFAPFFDVQNLYAGNGGDGSEGFVVRGVAQSDNFGVDTSALGDFNNDGIDDMAMGAFTLSPEERAFVLYGSDQSFPPEMLAVDLLQENGGDGTKGFTIVQVEQPQNELLGQAIAGQVDINGDGAQDLLISAERADSSSWFDSGRAYLIYGIAPDTDNDGTVDAFDICLLVPNSQQTDTDNDGFGNRCDADFNNDCIVNLLDLSLFANAFLGTDALYDMNDDGAVNLIDLSLFRDYFLLPPGPAGTGVECEFSNGT